MTEEDLLVELPGTVWINNYPFVLLETDKVQMQYLARSCSNVPASEIRVSNLQPRICQFLPVCVKNVWLRFCGTAEIGVFLTGCRSSLGIHW
jgi:hypothetical protein